MMNKVTRKIAAATVLITVCIVSLAFALSEFHTSITKVEYIAANLTLKMSTKVNANDIQEVLNKKANDKDFDNALSSYLKNNIKISINNAPTALSFSSKNMDGDVMWIYYEITKVGKISSISITNTLLIDKFPTQQNFINMIINGEKKSIACKKGKETGTVTF